MGKYNPLFFFICIRSTNEQRMSIYDNPDLTFDEAITDEQFDKLLRMRDEKMINLYVSL